MPETATADLTPESPPVPEPAPPALAPSPPVKGNPVPDSPNLTTDHFLDQLKKSNGEAKKYRLRARALRDESSAKDQRIAELEAALEEMSQGYESLEQQYGEAEARYSAEPSELQQRIDELTGELRTVKHRGVFERTAKKAGVREEAIDDLWSLSRYQPESDDPDEEHLTGLITEAVKARPWLAQPAANAATEGPDGPQSRAAQAQPKREPLPPGPGAARGNPSDQAALFKVTREKMADPRFTYENREEIAQAIKNKTFRVED